MNDEAMSQTCVTNPNPNPSLHRQVSACHWFPTGVSLPITMNSYPHFQRQLLEYTNARIRIPGFKWREVNVSVICIYKACLHTISLELELYREVKHKMTRLFIIQKRSWLKKKKKKKSPKVKTNYNYSTQSVRTEKFASDFDIKHALFWMYHRCRRT